MWRWQDSRRVWEPAFQIDIGSDRLRGQNAAASRTDVLQERTLGRMNGLKGILNRMQVIERTEVITG